MDGIKITKGVTRLVVSIGTGTIIGNAIKATTPSDTKLLDAITIFAASYFIGGLVADKTSDYADEFIDDVVKAWRSIRGIKPAEESYRSKHADDPNIVDGEVVEDHTTN